MIKSNSGMCNANKYNCANNNGLSLLTRYMFSVATVPFITSSQPEMNINNKVG